MRKGRIAITGLILCLLELPVLLGVWPGFFVYDAYEELQQVLTGSYTTHHPLLHVWLLGHIVDGIHSLTGSWNIGICAYIVIQMLIINMIFAYGIELLGRWGAGRIWRVVVLLFFGLCPTVVMYTLCSTKDGIFSAFLLLTILLLHEEKRAPAMVSATVMLLLRHNGIYAWAIYIVMMAVIWLVQRRRSGGRDAHDGRQCQHLPEWVLLMIPLVAAVGINAALTDALHAEGGEHQELLSIPIQQIGRTHNSYREELPVQEREALYRYLPEDMLVHYTERLADPLKQFFDNRAYEADRVSFWRLWLAWGLRHPGSYLNAWRLVSQGYIDPRITVDAYEGHQVFTFTYGGSSYFGYETEPPGERASLIPTVDGFYRMLSLDPRVQHIPVIGLLMAPATWFWIDLACMLILAHRRDRLAWCALPVFLVWLTVIAGPAFLVRYVIYLWYIAPFLLFKASRGKLWSV